MDKSATDGELLRTYIATSSEEAFAELVRRHIGWIHASARRLTADEHLADDVTQATFIVLAKTPPKAHPDAPLSAWLFQVLRNVGKSALRMKRRRTFYEFKAATMRKELTIQEDLLEWADLEPLVDELVGTLNAGDRQAILLQFYERKPLSDIARALGVSNDAARKRIERALRRLRDLAGKRGLVTSVSAIASTMTLHLRPAMPTAAAEAVAAAGCAARGSIGSTSAQQLAEHALRTVRVRALWTAVLTASVFLAIVLSSAWALNGRTGSQGASAAAPRTLAATNGTPRVPARIKAGYIVSHSTVTGPSNAFHGGHYSHAHPRVLPALADPSIEFWAVIEPGTHRVPAIMKIVNEVFSGRWIDGSNYDDVKTCDVFVAAGIANAAPELLSTVDRAVQDGAGLLRWIGFGTTSPGRADPIVRRLNGLDNNEPHHGYFSLDWVDCTIVGQHPILGQASGRVGQPLKLRPDVSGKLVAGATPLIQIPSDGRRPALFPLFVTANGRGRVVHIGFATYTQIPKELDRLVGGGFSDRCISWLAAPRLSASARVATSKR
jgi:RNA polymerase sigma factor (sigma-70 family)